MNCKSGLLPKMSQSLTELHSASFKISRAAD